MNMKFIKSVFLASAVYDGVLALLFLFFSSSIFEYFGIEKPNHMGYLHFPALLLILFAIMYWRIASDPIRFRDLIPYGIGLKISYCAVVFYHWLTGGIPNMWIPFAWIDFAFIILFIQAWRSVKNINRTAA
jgi:hypothetical protein